MIERLERRIAKSGPPKVFDVEAEIRFSRNARLIMLERAERRKAELQAKYNGLAPAAGPEPSVASPAVLSVPASASRPRPPPPPSIIASTAPMLEPSGDAVELMASSVRRTETEPAEGHVRSGSACLFGAC
jgi:hypothetical protein